MTINVAKINGREVKYDDAAVASNQGSSLTKKVIYTSMQVSDRLIKLNAEFKAGEAYLLQQSSHSQKEVIPDLEDPFIIEFKQKFIKACISTGKASGHVRKGEIDTITLKSLASSALTDLRDLQTFSMSNSSKANSLFEKAFYDTNADGIAAGVAALGTCGLSLFVGRQGREFTDKLVREIDDFNQLSSLVSELEAYIPHE